MLPMTTWMVEIKHLDDLYFCSLTGDALDESEAEVSSKDTINDVLAYVREKLAERFKSGDRIRFRSELYASMDEAIKGIDQATHP